MFPPDEMLWCLNTRLTQKLPGGLLAPHVRVNIAHTVVLRRGILAAWFFTSVKDGSVKKKKRYNLTVSNVIAHFCRPRPPELADMPVAFFVAYDSKSGGDPVRKFKYIMESELQVCKCCAMKLELRNSQVRARRNSYALRLRSEQTASATFPDSFSSGRTLPPATTTSFTACGRLQ
jgi:hypothetical protein